MTKEIRFNMSDEAYHRLMVLKADRKSETVSEVFRDGLSWLRTIEEHKDRNGNIKITRGDSVYTFKV